MTLLTPPPLDDRELAWISDTVREAGGIRLGPHKRSLIQNRLRGRLAQLGMASFRPYVDLLRREPGELDELLDRITTQETAFLREPWQFELLARDLLQAWSREAEAGTRRRHLRIWSAACATGEEPYSVAMTVLDALPQPETWTIDILATDLSRDALARTRSATWPLSALAPLSEAQRRHFEIDRARGSARAGEALARMVRVAPSNLIDEQLPGGPFDLILCRNVLIYFDPDTRRRVLERLVSRLPPEGYLFLGHAETAHGFHRELRLVEPSVYARR